MPRSAKKRSVSTTSKQLNDEANESIRIKIEPGIDSEIGAESGSVDPRAEIGSGSNSGSVDPTVIENGMETESCLSLVKDEPCEVDDAELHSDTENEDENSADYSVLTPGELIEKELAMATDHLEVLISPEDIAAIQDEIVRGVALLQTEIEHTKPLTCDVCGKMYKLRKFLERHMKMHQVDTNDNKSANTTTYYCDVAGCSKEFDTRDRLVRHEGKVHGIKTYQCKTCSKRFSTPCDMRKHEEIHSEVAQYRCNECNRAFKTKGYLKRHVDGVHLKKKQACPYCGVEYTKYDAIKQHIRAVHTHEKPYQCSYCDRRFHRHFCWSQHERTHTGYKPYACDVCTLTFYSSGDLSKHKKRHLGYKPFACTECPMAFALRNDLKKHITITHSDEKPHECDQCEAKFKTLSALKTHVRNVHICERNHECKICGKKFKSMNNLSLHLKWHIGDARFKCHLCSQSFVLKKDLERHVQRHQWVATGTKPYKCDICNKAFATRCYMLKHRILHNSERKECPQCHKDFKTTATLKSHLLTHTGKKPFACSRCSARFYTKVNLAVHERVHTGEKPYRCRHCDKGFTQRANRNTHEQAIHTGEKTHKCDLCDKAFVFADRLVVHRYKMHRKKDIQCPKCPRMFRRQGSLKLHLMKHNGNHYNRKIEKPFSCRLCIMRFKSEAGLKTHNTWKHDGASVKEEVVDDHEEEDKDEEDHDPDEGRVTKLEPVSDEDEERKAELNLSADYDTTTGPGRAAEARRGSFRCSQCSESFVSKSRLVQHLRRHVRVDTTTESGPAMMTTRSRVKITSNGNQDSNVENRVRKVGNNSKTSKTTSTGKKRKNEKRTETKPKPNGIVRANQNGEKTFYNRQCVEIVDTREPIMNGGAENTARLAVTPYRDEATPFIQGHGVRVKEEEETINV